MGLEREANALAWKIYERLAGIGCEIGNASVSYIEAEIEEFVSDIIERAARVAEQPITGNGHSPETRAKSEHALVIARSIRELKGPQPKRTRRLR